MYLLESLNMTLLANRLSPLDNQGAGYLYFSCSKPIPSPVIIPFLDFADLDATCRVNHAFKETLIATSFTSVSDLYKRAICFIISTEHEVLPHLLSYTKKKLQEIISLAHCKAMENILSLQEKPGYFQAMTPEQLSLAFLEYVRKKSIFPLTLYKRLILATPKSFVDRLVHTLDHSKQYFENAFLQLMLNLSCDLDNQNIPMPHKWALLFYLRYEDDYYKTHLSTEIPEPGKEYSDWRITQVCHTLITKIFDKLETGRLLEGMRQSCQISAGLNLMFVTMVAGEISSDEIKNEYFGTIAKGCLEIAKTEPVFFQNLLNTLPHFYAVKLASLTISKLEPQDVEITDTITVWIHEKNRVRQESAKALEQSVARTAAQIYQHSPIISSASEGQISLLSFYWNNSILFRIFSILTLGFLPLAVFLWEELI